MSKFKVGEVCIFQNAKYCPEFNGVEVTVLAVELTRMDLLTGVWHQGVYEIESPAHSGGAFNAHEHQLRKKRPPESDDATSHQAMLDCIERAQRGIEVPA